MLKIQLDTVGRSDSVEIFRQPVSAIGSETPEGADLNPGANEWVFSINDNRVTPLKIKWLDQDFAAAIKQQQIDLVIDSYPEEAVSNAILDLAGLNGLITPVVDPYKSAVELHISLMEMLSSLAGDAVHDRHPEMAAHHSERYDASLQIFFKVFSRGAIGVQGAGQSAVLYVLEWILEHLEMLKAGGVTALLIDQLQDSDELEIPVIVGRLETIETSGLSLCFLQSEPPQVLKISDLNNIFSKLSHISFIVRGLLLEKISPPLEFSEKDYPEAVSAELRFNQKKNMRRKTGLPWQKILPDGELLTTEVEKNKIRKIFNLKLAGLTVSQIAKILSCTGVPRFVPINQVSSQSRINLWSRSIVMDVLNAVYDFGSKPKNYSPKKTEQSSEGLESALSSVIFPVIISESVYCLARQPFPVSGLSMEVRETKIKTKKLLMTMLGDKIFCACDSHQEFLLKIKSNDALAYLSPLRHRACSCRGLVADRDALEERMKTVVLTLAAGAPRVSDLAAIVKNELEELISHGNEYLKSSKFNYEEKRKISVIDSSIGVMSRKINWLSNDHIQFRLDEFSALLNKEFLDSGEAIRFASLGQDVIASVFLDVHTGAVKFYWAHSLVCSESRLGEIVEQKSQGALLIPLHAAEALS